MISSISPPQEIRGWSAAATRNVPRRVPSICNIPPSGAPIVASHVVMDASLASGSAVDGAILTASLPEATMRRHGGGNSRSHAAGGAGLSATASPGVVVSAAVAEAGFPDASANPTATAWAQNAPVD
ncbi:MAG: hypothetical protein ACNA8L_10725 [Luteolibacter sp.]